MRKIPEIACQLSFYPLNESNINPPIAKVLSLLEQSGLLAEVGPMSSIIRGEPGMVFALLQEITEKMNGEGSRFSINATISNICGCE